MHQKKIKPKRSLLLKNYRAKTSVRTPYRWHGRYRHPLHQLNYLPRIFLALNISRPISTLTLFKFRLQEYRITWYLTLPLRTIVVLLETSNMTVKAEYVNTYTNNMLSSLVRTSIKRWRKNQIIYFSPTNIISKFIFLNFRQC